MAEVEQTVISSEPVEDTLFDSSLKKKKKSKSKPTFETPEDEVSDVKSELEKKKKKKKEKKEESESKEGTPLPEGGEEGTEFEFKKKKKKSKSAAAQSEFDAELEKAGIEGGNEETPVQKSKYSNVNADGEPDFTYEELLSRFFVILRENNPDLAGDRTGVKYKIPPPAVARDGNKKSLFSNVKDIADRMHRPTEHVIQFLFAELGTSGSVDGSNRLVIKGRFQQKQIESVLRRYIMEYVTCKTCKSVNTKLTKENRLYFLECNSCGSRRSVSSIKTGYQAIIKRGRK